MSERCKDYDFYYQAWVAARTISETDGLEAKAALMAHAAACKICTQAVQDAFESSKPLPEVDHVSIP